MSPVKLRVLCKKDRRTWSKSKDQPSTCLSASLCLLIMSRLPAWKVKGVHIMHALCPSKWFGKLYFVVSSSGCFVYLNMSSANLWHEELKWAEPMTIAMLAQTGKCRALWLSVKSSKVKFKLFLWSLQDCINRDSQFWNTITWSAFLSYCL